MTIQHTIHQIWVGGPPPAEIISWIDTWRHLHPGWDHVFWRDGDLRWLENLDLFDRAHEYVADHAVGQLKADIARYEVLDRYGGIYVDCDFEALRPIDELVDGVSAFTVWQPEGPHPANGLIGVGPGHQVIQKCIERLPERAERFRGKSAGQLSGPGLFGPLARNDITFTIYPSKWFFPYSWRDVEKGEVTNYNARGCYAIHHWLHRRQMFGLSLRI